MQTIPVKVNGDYLQAYEYSQPEKEMENAITSAGITLTNTDLTQLAKAIATYATVGNFYADSGTSNNYLLSSISPLQPITAYREGMIVRFYPLNSNTGATTININSIGSVAIVDDNGNALVGGEIIGDKECTVEFDGTNFFVSLGMNETRTGQVIHTYASSQSGWILVNTLGTIGDATSGASIRTNADCQALFLMLWNNCADAQCPVISGRGASAVADWTAHKQLTIPAHGNRVIATRTSQALGLTEGAATVTLGITEIPAHTHLCGGANRQQKPAGGGSDTWVDDSVATTGGSGGGLAHNNMQPTIYLNALMKL